MSPKFPSVLPWAAIVLLTVAGSPGGLHSEQTKLPLRGMVVDPTGSVVPNFAVEIRPRTPDSLSVRETHTDREGQFSADLAPGTYQVCAPRFPKSCRDVVVGKGSISPEYLTLKINPSEEIHDPGLPDNRFRAIAGIGAENCGHVAVKESREAATKCAQRALKHHQAFYVIYDDPGVDSYVAYGMAADARGKLYAIEFDSEGMDPDYVHPGATRPDGFHTNVIPCTEPIRVHVTVSKALTCMVDGGWLMSD